jgi:4-oxalocrotonate tautomerase family enzyme
LPILHVYVTEGLLDDGQKKRLFEGLTKAVLRGEAAPDNAKTRSVTWVFLHEMKKGTWAVGGVVSDSLRFLVEIEIPQGALNDRRRQRMAAGVGQVLTDIAGRELPMVDSMVKIQEVIDGDWSAGGKVLRLRDIAAFVRTP